MTVPQEVIDRVRARLRQDAEGLPIEAAISRVQASADSLHAVAGSIPIERFDVAPATGGWSPAEVLAHAVESNVRHAQQILYVALSGELPADEPVTLPAERDALIASHQDALDSLYIHVRDADPDAFILTTWPHSIFGELNWREWLLFLELHTLDHARQLEAISNA